MPLYEMVSDTRKRFYPPAFIARLRQRFGDVERGIGQTMKNKFGYIIDMAERGDERLFEEIIKAADANTIDFDTYLFHKEIAEKQALRKMNTLLLLAECTRMEMEYEEEERAGRCRQHVPYRHKASYVEPKDRKGWPSDNFPPPPRDERGYTSDERNDHLDTLLKAYLTPEAYELYTAAAGAHSVGRSIIQARPEDVARVRDAFIKMGELLGNFGDIANKLTKE